LAQFQGDTFSHTSTGTGNNGNTLLHTPIP
jgi:hypothetical protein